MKTIILENRTSAVTFKSCLRILFKTFSKLAFFVKLCVKRRKRKNVKILTFLTLLLMKYFKIPTSYSLLDTRITDIVRGREK